jgi:hypothetical protein
MGELKMSLNKSFALLSVAAACLSAGIACSTLDLARDMLGNLAPTETPASARFESRTWYVASDGDDGNTCQDPADACRTIGEVLDERATSEDFIYVGPGTYAEPVNLERMLVIRDMNLHIEGDGQGSTIIDGQNQGAGFYVSGEARVTLKDMTVRNGWGNGPGNCISVRSTRQVTIENVAVEHCSWRGIGHHGEGELRLINVTVQDAHKEESEFGGTGVSSVGPLVIEGGQISGNAGTGLISIGAATISGTRFEGNGLDGLVINGSADISDIHVSGNDIDPVLGPNHAGIQIGDEAEATIRQAVVENNDVGVRVSEGGRLHLEQSTVTSHPRTGLLLPEMSQVTLVGTMVSDNGSFYADTSLPGGIANRGDLTLRDSVVEANHNGGIGNYGNLVMRGSTVRANFGRLAGLYNHGDADISGSLFTGQSGGEDGVENRGLMTMVNSTVSGNESVGIGQISDDGLILRYVTIANNSIGLNAHRGGERIRLIANSLIANNTGRSDCLFSTTAPDPSLEGVNLDSDGSCRFGAGSSSTAIGLGPLQDNGGPTLTHAIEADSDALNAATGDCPSVDQRAESRPVGPACDVGAFELGATTMSATVEPGALATVTPTPTSSTPTVLEDKLCWQGPGPQYEVVSALKAGTEVQILGRGIEGDWWVIDNPRYPGVRCWTPGEAIEVQPNLDFPDTLFEIPPLPTATPQPGCLWYDQQQQEACFPIDACPVDFEDSLGACTP